ncbi:MAG: Ig-like domain-containing protein [Flavobacteriales bacterium]|nr:Ig-like domain-containing protein [Flavobacteriales bacterium]MEB2341065.1 Ig-like domain-containing protein [Flavobacteriia bacterium]
MRNTAALSALLLLAACAQVKEPQGGPKDTAAPRLLSAMPPNGSTGFSDNRIVLHFDERIKLDRVHERLLVSPPLDKMPEVAVSAATDVVITLAAPLREGTTYTFNIGEAVIDLTEGNPASGLTYVLSTGDHVDSLALEGRVEDAFTGLPVADALVLLHDARDTGDVRTAPPAYFTRTAKDGRFRLAHLRGGPMHLAALVDRNGNYRYDLPNEEIAFLDSLVDPRDTVPYRLFLFRPVAAVQFVAAAKVLPERGWQLAMARRASDLTLASLDREGGRTRWWSEWNDTRDTVTLWPSDTTLLAGQRFVVLEGGVPLDTLAYKPTAPMPFNVAVAAKADPASGRWWLECTRPVAAVDPGHARLVVDGTERPWSVAADSIRGRMIGLDLRPKPGQAMELVLFPKAVTAIMGGTNDTTRLNLSAPDPRTLGKLEVDLPADSLAERPGPYIVQLLTTQGGILRQQVLAALPGRVKWEAIPPGSYTLKLVHDRNGDGRWTTGSFEPRMQPERVFLAPDAIMVRAGWVVAHTWRWPIDTP